MCELCNDKDLLVSHGLEAIPNRMDVLRRTFPGLIENAEVRLNGICRNCLRRKRKE